MKVKLTAKEREAAEMYAEGLTTLQIARRLGITTNAVSMRITGAARKRGIRDTRNEGLVLIARRVLEVA